VTYAVRLTVAHVLRHAPAQSAQGRDAALVDIAQDLLLRHLTDTEVLSHVAFKGGTALRKLYAGADGRFSTDLDFAVKGVGDDPGTVTELLVETIDGAVVGPFRFGVSERRGRYSVTYDSDLGAVTYLKSQLDIGPPPWLAPEQRPWVPLPVHGSYGGPLPSLDLVCLEENLAEKIARLNRRTPARDVYDLVWVAERYARRPGNLVEWPLVRRLAVLKCWVDTYGLAASGSVWKRAEDPRPFDPDHWLRKRRRGDFDDEDIGLLANPAPDLDDLADAMRSAYSFLAELDPDERHVVEGGGAVRPDALRLLAALPGGRLGLGTCW
jgi:predicted nucleotidyltransferase component of viral defense system